MAIAVVSPRLDADQVERWYVRVDCSLDAGPFETQDDAVAFAWVWADTVFVVKGKQRWRMER